MGESEQVRIVLVGIGGYAGQYVAALLDGVVGAGWRLVGVVDPLAEKSPHYERLKALNVPFFGGLDEFYATENADLAVIASPIQYHCVQACTAMRHGTHVLCEKPISAVIQDALEMARVSRETGCFCAIGYQWSYSEAIQALKSDILAGRYGKALRLRTLVLWPRSDAYYHRNSWAGGLKSAGGDWILDSPVNNATAHYLHNMLFVLGRDMAHAAEPKTVQAELYRANDITNYDTASLRVMTEDGVELLFYCSHAIGGIRGPEFIYEFDHGVVTYDTCDGHVIGRRDDGEVRDYGVPDSGVAHKLSAAIKAVSGDRSGIVCDAETAMMQTKCMNGAQESMGNVQVFPPENLYLMGVPGAAVTIMEGLAEAMGYAYDRGKMLSEACPRPWSRMGQVKELAQLVSFPSC